MSSTDLLPDGPPPPLPQDVFRRRRERFMERIGDGAVILPAAAELLSSRDTDVPYRPNSDLYYLTGLTEPQTLAVLTRKEGEPHLALFVRPRERDREVWTGTRLGVEGALELSGADEAHTVDQLDAKLFDLAAGAGTIHFPIGLDPRLDARVSDLVTRARRGRVRTGRGPIAIHDLDATLGGMRRVKDPEELERMRVAARITASAHRLAREHTRPGMGEWEVEAVLEAAFRSHGSEGPAFPSIVAAGPNATTLHYTANSRRIGADELLLIDAGAEWGMYASDMTRTFPAAGRFSGAQADVYEVVRAAERAGIAAAAPGAPVSAVHDAAVRVLSDGLLRLGIARAANVDELIEQGGYRRFYMHQTSHWLGLDVHDPGLYHDGEGPVTLTPGMVLTVEPGLYLPADDDQIPAAFRGIGVRIEDTVAITGEGREVLTGVGE